MSLTSLLRTNEDVRARFRKEFPKQKFAIRREVLAPPLSNRYSLVGTAFDYLLRFYLKRLNQETVFEKSWIAEADVDLLIDWPKLYKKGLNIVAQARKNVKNFLKTGRITENLIKYAILLGQLDPIYRAGVGYESIGLIYKEDVQDLKKLISVVEPSLFKAKKICLINPTFGKASTLVGGADADAVIDDTIIDIKTTKTLALRKRDFQQLMGYYVLHQIGQIGELKPKLEIKKVAIYFSRYAYLHYFKIGSIVDKTTLPAFIKWCVWRARSEFLAF